MNVTKLLPTTRKRNPLTYGKERPQRNPFYRNSLSACRHAPGMAVARRGESLLTFTPMHKNRQAAVVFIFFTVLIDVMGVGLIIPVLPGLIMELKQCSLSEASVAGGTLLVTYALTQFLMAPVIGNISDRFGRRPVLLLALFGLTLDYLFMTWAPTLGWLYLGRVLAGVMGSSYTTAQAYIADISTPETRAKNYGMLGAAFGMGFIAGPLLGGLLGELGLRIPFVAAAVLTFFNFLYGYFIVPESLAATNRRKFDWLRANPVGAFVSLKRNPTIVGLALAMFFVYMAGQCMPSVWSYFTMERLGWSSSFVGVSLAIVGLLVAFVQAVLIRRINPMLGNEKSVILGMVLWSGALFLFSVAGSTAMMLLTCIPYCLGGIAGPAVQAIMSTRVNANEQGELQGAMTAIMSLTLVLSPGLMTGAFSLFTSDRAPLYYPGAPFFLAGVFCLTGLTVAWYSLHHKPKRASRV